MVNIGLVRGYDASGDGITILDIVEPGSAALGGPFVDVTKAPYNADPSGATDNTAKIQTALNEQSPLGVALYFPAGTYLFTTPVQMVEGALIWATNATKFLGNVAGAAISNSIFFSPLPAIVGADTLSVANTIGSRDISLTNLIPGTVVGSYIEIIGVANQYRWTARVESIAGVSPAVLTLDRGVDLPFSLGSSAGLLAAKPLTWGFYGNGCTMSGQAVAYIAGFGWHCLVSRVNLIDLTGANVDAGIGFQSGSYDCNIEYCSVDATGVGAAFNAGIFLEADHLTAFACSVVNGGAFCSAIKFADATSCNALACNGSGCGFGVAFATDVASPVGCKDCQVIAGHYDNNGTNCFISNGSYECWVGGGATFNNSTIGPGVDLTGTGTLMADNILDGLSCNNNKTYGVRVRTGTKRTVITNITTNGNINAGIRSEDECSIDHHECQATAVAAGASCLEIPGAGTHVILGQHKYVLANAATFAVYLEVAARLDVSEGDVRLNAGSYAYRSGAAGAVLTAHHCKVSVSGGATTGFYADPGATVRIGECVDVSATATPQGGAGVNYYNRGVCVGNVAVAWPDLKATDRVVVTPNAGAIPFGITEVPGVGFTAIDATGAGFNYVVV
jgi:hypothetical protein